MAIGTLLISACLALGVFSLAATDGEMYYRIQKKLNVDAGIPGDTMRAQDILLGKYLAGDRSALDESIFNDREIAHMADVYDIFAMLRKIAAICAPIGAVMVIIASILPGGGKRRAVRGAVIGAGLFFLPLVIIALWAVIDFSSAFIAMHHILFSNDLWLMDPKTDVMIRMLPERFFTFISIYLIGASLIAALTAPIISAAAGVFTAHRAGFSRYSDGLYRQNAREGADIERRG